MTEVLSLHDLHARVAKLEEQMATMMEMLSDEDDEEAQPAMSLDGDAIGGERDWTQGLD